MSTRSWALEKIARTRAPPTFFESPVDPTDMTSLHTPPWDCGVHMVSSVKSGSHGSSIRCSKRLLLAFGARYRGASSLPPGGSI